MNQKDRFNKIWDIRYQSPYITKSWAESDWAKGRTDWLTLIIRLKDREIINQVQKVQNILVKFECIEIFPVEFFHFTIKELAFLVDEKQNPDEITKEELQLLITSIQKIIRDLKPFEIELMNLNNFKSTVCIEGHDNEVINNINGEFLKIEGVKKYKHDYPGFLPHLSIAQYKNTEEYEQLIEYLEYSRETYVGALKVDKFELVIAKIPIKERFPILKPVKIFYL